MNSKLRSFSRISLLGAVAALGACDGGDPVRDCVPGVDAGCPVPPGSAIVTGNITADRTFHAETTYVLSGYVKVTGGATLTIQPGTRIVGDTLTPGSSLWILRGARIIAEGTADRPIVFTSQRAPGNRRPGDWGGIVIIGNGIINRTGAGISTEGPPGTVAENYAAGTDNNDSSGSLRYVRIEFAGYDVTGTGQELNSLSLYAVGRGTRLEYVQTLAGLDDGFEWWGGAVDGRYLVSVQAGDDHFDWTEGYQGRNQFVIAFQNGQLDPRPGTGTLSSDPRGFEGDGCDPQPGSGCVVTAGETNQPYSQPVFANFTLVGSREITPSEGNGMVLRRGTAGTFYNGVVARWKGIGLNVRDAFTDRQRIAGRLDVRSLVFAGNAVNYDAETSTQYGKQSVFGANGMREAASAGSLFLSLATGAPDFTPAAGSLLTSGGSVVPAERVSGYRYGWTNTTYVGAVDPSGSARWFQGWTSFATN
ncbi:MAG TPA: hypothetical protein VHG28_15900 [Longimicrobiaceae bacterium]|nr:hypothetical protein [Longimicrobiaceae bacterium]